jgi:hypothetical protein
MGESEKNAFVKCVEELSKEDMEAEMEKLMARLELLRQHREVRPSAPVLTSQMNGSRSAPVSAARPKSLRVPKVKK